MINHSILKHHSFTGKIISILKDEFGDDAIYIFENSPILGYLNIKTKSAERGSKSRGSFANHYALYVIIEDYINKGYLCDDLDYSKYDGAKFTDLFRRQRELPFGSKLQNHALNSRLNDEFKKFFPTLGIVPIIRDVRTSRYWIQEDLIKVSVRNKNGIERRENLAPSIIRIIDEYIATKKESFELFLKTCQEIANLSSSDPHSVVKFIQEQLHPSSDARVFEIVSYAVLKERYSNQTIWIGDSRDDVAEESLVLYKTGRTNANDGGIDFVMKPLGRFFQVTETIDANKYFLDIDKVQRFPITFVVKTNSSYEEIEKIIKEQAKAKYNIEAIVNSYMDSIEEIINVPDLMKYFEEMIYSDSLKRIMDEIIVQSKVEFNYEEDVN